ncbi:MAG: hypothetical protein ACI82N_001319, partial [Maricaulis sp.]
AERIDRRIVGDDDEDIPDALGGDHRHVPLLSIPVQFGPSPLRGRGFPDLTSRPGASQGARTGGAQPAGLGDACGKLC